MKKEFQWNEDFKYLKAIKGERSLPPFSYLLIGVGVFLFYLAISAYHQFKGFSFEVAFSFFIIAALAAIITYLYDNYQQDSILITDQHIIYHAEQYEFSELKEILIENRKINGHIYNVFWFVTSEGYSYTINVPDKINVKKLLKFFEAKGVKMA